MKTVLRGLLMAVCLGVLIVGAADTKNFRWTQKYEYTADSINCADTIYGKSIAIPTAGFWVWVDLDSAGAGGTGGYDSLLIKFQTQPAGGANWVTAGAIAGVTTALSLGITDTDEFPIVKYFHPDTMANYVLAEMVRPMMYFAPTDQDADSTVQSATAGGPALSLKFWYGWDE